MLDELGHAVSAAESGPAALALLREATEYDLALVDFAMPGMTGAQFAEQAITVRPMLPVLLMTGYVESAARQSWSERGYRTLMKPFNTAELAAVLLPLTSPGTAGEVSRVAVDPEVETREQRA
jgi:CheY-like chemotaxis protein